MKILIYLPLYCLVAGFASAEFRTWTSKDEKTVELELLSVSDVDGEKVGEFRMRNGKKTKVKASALNDADAKALEDWKPAPVASKSKSVFDKILDDNLDMLDGKSLKPIKNFSKPTKYYLFYYTASWCGPCKKFTPSLVKFYKENKTDEFEIVLISSDRDKASMAGYASSAKMEWPHLKLSMVEKFRDEHKHPGTGIPNLVLCDTEGKIIMSSYTSDGYIGPSPVMNHLGELLKK